MVVGVRTKIGNPFRHVTGRAYLTFEDDVLDVRIATRNERRNQFTTVMAVVEVAIDIDRRDDACRIRIVSDFRLESATSPIEPSLDLSRAWECSLIWFLNWTRLFVILRHSFFLRCVLLLLRTLFRRDAEASLRSGSKQPFKDSPDDEVAFSITW